MIRRSVSYAVLLALTIGEFGGKRQIWHCEFGGKRHFGLKTFGGGYEKPYFCIKIKDYGRGYNSF